MNSFESEMSLIVSLKTVSPTYSYTKYHLRGLIPGRIFPRGIRGQSTEFDTRLQ